ncbi:MAG: hypothetical protein KKD35_02165, partial [Elusimicrobia bacterium]|nr:hypothetical protein [Elusimicrobiota bacterium]
MLIRRSSSRVSILQSGLGYRKDCLGHKAMPGVVSRGYAHQTTKFSRFYLAEWTGLTEVCYG